MSPRNTAHINLNIRPAIAADIPVLLTMIRELAEYERLLHEVVVTSDDLKRWLFGSEKLADAIIAEREGKPIGYAVFFSYYNTFRGKPGMYLEDLYVREPYRGAGVGEAMLQHIACLAEQRDCVRMEWVVLDWNTPAIDFYRRLGAVPAESGWTTFGLNHDALRRVAQH